MAEAEYPNHETDLAYEYTGMEIGSQSPVDVMKEGKRRGHEDHINVGISLMLDLATWRPARYRKQMGERKCVPLSKFFLLQQSEYTSILYHNIPP